MPTHISLDFWNTLAQSNPEFNAQRIECLAEGFGVSEVEAEEAFRQVKQHHDDNVAGTGESATVVQCYAMVAHKLWGDKTLTERDWDHLYSISEDVQMTAMDYPPVISPATVDVMRVLWKQGVTFNITSNTSFISGETLRIILKDAAVPLYFTVFSDEYEYAKPDPRMFGIVRALRPSYNLFHYGDHQVCDVDGALAAGFQSELVSYETLPEKLLSHAEKSELIT